MTYREGMTAGIRAEARFAELYERAEAARAQTRALTGQIRATQAKIRAECQRIQAAADRAEQVRQLWLAPPGAERLRYSAYARLQARLTSMPVIEQAKGIVMAQCGWPADQAFAALRQASQRENIKLRDLAQRIVARTATPARPPLPHRPASGSPAVNLAESDRPARARSTAQ